MTNAPLSLSSTVSIRRDGNIAFVNIDNPPVNALSATVIDGLNLALDQIERDPEIQITLLYCSGRGFIAGADLKEIASSGRNRSDDAAAMVNRIAQTTKPVLAAIHGNALGGGFETALACDYRCCTVDAHFGLPEVNIGAMPGYGATQRLPRLTSLEMSLELMITGKTIDAQSAHKAGIVDQVYREELLTCATAYAKQLLRTNAPLRKVDNMPTHTSSSISLVFNEATLLANKLRPGEDAPALILESVRNALDMPIQQGLKRERQLSSTRVSSSQGLAMRHLFFSERRVKKSPELSHYLNEDDNALHALTDQDNERYALGYRLMAPLISAIRLALQTGKTDTQIASDLQAFGWQSSKVNQLVTICLKVATSKTSTPLGDNWVEDSIHGMVAAGYQLLKEYPFLVASDLDVISCNTYGFPRFRGGVMYFGD